MTMLLDELEVRDEAPGAGAPEPPPEQVVAEREEAPLRLSAVVLAGALSSAAAAWLGGGLIRGTMPQVIALAGVVIGAAVSYAALRMDRPSVQYAALPVAALAGAVLITPEAKGGTANLPGLVREAITGGGLVQPPVPFNPGWRFILVVLFAVVAVAAIGLASALRKPKLAVAVPLPLFVGGALLQPEAKAIVASSVGVVLLIGALAVAFGAEMSSDETRALSRGFELRRLLRGVAMLVAAVVGIVALSQAGFLFPKEQQQKVIPPRRPPDAPIEKDRELFRVDSGFRGPVRVGVLDEYDGEAWLLPPEDPRRLTKLGDLPERLKTAETKPLRFEIVDMSGLALPVPAGLVAIRDTKANVDWDPRVAVPRLRSRLPQGLSYTAVTAALPLAAELDVAPPARPEIGDAFTHAPPPPNAVLTLLGQAPEAKFSRLQFLREQFYKTVELAGGGGPKEVSPARVAQLLQEGAQATPFEVVATEALLARWAGVPARIGYGYFGGNPVGDSFSFRPRHGRAWLEAYFEGYGWVPLVGTPPRAAASLSQQAKVSDPNVEASNNLAVVVYVPVRQPNIRLLFEVVRYWVLVALPFVVGGVALVLLYPVGLKAIRSYRRRRWGVAHGAVGETLVAYAEFRDRINDLNLGDVRDTPLAFVERFSPDNEHDELAWLATRLFWGDLRRDPRPDDVREAQAMIASVRSRIVGAQPFGNRATGWISRASLQDPYNDDVPNFYPRPWRGLRAAARLPARAVKRLRPRLRGAPQGATVLLLALLLTACGAAQGSEPAPAAFPPSLPPDGLLGLAFTREPTAETEYARAGADGLVADGRVFTMREGETVQGVLQVGLFKEGYDTGDRKVRTQVERGIAGAFSTFHVGTIRLRVAERPEQRLYLWFPPERNAMVLVVLRKEYQQPDELIRKLVGSLRGLPVDRLLSEEELA